MYFRAPKQLLEIFTQLEEQNLFLIQNSQETEQALEELKQDFTATQVSMDAKVSSLIHYRRRYLLRSFIRIDVFMAYCMHVS